jgi:hypothetical protein
LTRFSNTRGRMSFGAYCDVFVGPAPQTVLSAVEKQTGLRSYETLTNPPRPGGRRSRFIDKPFMV